MNNTLTVFRAFIVASILTSLLGATLDLLVPSLIDVDLSAAYDTYTSEDPTSVALIIAMGVFALVLLVLAIASSIGMYLLKQWSRRLALWATLLSLLMYPPLGSTLSSGWAVMLVEISMMLWGAVLAMAWFSELRVHFEPPGR